VKRSQTKFKSPVGQTKRSEMSGLTSVIHDTSVKLDKEIDKILSSSFASKGPHLSKTVKYYSPAKKTNSIQPRSPPRSVPEKI